MRMVASLAAALAFGLFVPSSAVAQEGRIGVHISNTSNDSVGRKLIFHLRDKIRKSGTFREVASGEEAGFVLYVVTMDQDSDSPGVQTIYSVTITLSSEGLDDYITSYVGLCGSDMVSSCADNIYTGLGETVEEIRDLYKARETFADP